MPRRRNLAGAPRSFIADGEWPRAELTAAAPRAALYAQEIARLLESALEGRSKVEVAAAADLHRSTLYDILGGKRWPDVVSLAKLESVLDVRLWPDRPRMH